MAFTGIVLSLLLAMVSNVACTQFLKSGDIRVYANAMLSSQLDAQMARQYGITRSDSRVMLHVVVREGTPSKRKNLPACITSVVLRKNGSGTDINMKLKREGQDIYYLGELNISGNEAINFEIIAQIDKQQPMRMSFFQEFFVK